ncbi:MAG: hypothetical protein ACOY7U_02145 [Acidobacteriota bacterium]
MLLLPWELARGLACEKSKKRLFRFLSLAVAFSWFPPVASWWESLLIQVVSPTSLGNLGKALRLFDVHFWNLDQWRFPWAQLVSLAFLTCLALENYHQTPTFDGRHPGVVGAAKVLRAFNTLIVSLLVSGVSYEVLRSLFVYCYSHRPPWSLAFLASSAVPLPALVFLLVKRKWLLAGQGPLESKRSGTEGLRKAVKILSVIGHVALGLVVLSLIVVLLQAVFPVFPLDVIPDPRGASTTVCPFLSSRQLTLGLWLLIGGVFLGELAKVVTQELVMNRRVWWLTLVFQCGVVLPLALALLWPWLRIALLQLIDDLPLPQLAAKQYSWASELLPQGFLVSVGGIVVWAFRRALRTLASKTTPGTR